MALLKSTDGSVLALLRLPSIFSSQNSTVGEFWGTMAVMKEKQQNFPFEIEWAFQVKEELKEEYIDQENSEVEEEERSIPKDWADQVEEECKEIPGMESDIEEEKVFRTKVNKTLYQQDFTKKREEEPQKKKLFKARVRDFVQGLKL